MANVHQSTNSKRPTTRDLLVIIADLMLEQKIQLELLNRRFESVHNTSITLQDIQNDTIRGRQ